jgi:hypothetical protein
MYIRNSLSLLELVVVTFIAAASAALFITNLIIFVLITFVSRTR